MVVVFFGVYGWVVAENFGVFETICQNIDLPFTQRGRHGKGSAGLWVSNRCLIQPIPTK